MYGDSVISSHDQRVPTLRIYTDSACQLTLTELAISSDAMSITTLYREVPHGGHDSWGDASHVHSLENPSGSPNNVSVTIRTHKCQ